MLGQTISHYQILEKLGAGGMGDVYLALDQSLERRVALKFLKKEVFQTAHYRQILAEARAVAAVDHPFVCKVYEASEVDGQAFMVLEYVSGVTLRECLRAGPLAADVAIKYGCEIAEALIEVHARGLVHQDIKPLNIMITQHGHVKLMDFGLARQLLSPVNQDQTAVPARGTPSYMAPEQFHGECANSRTDIFALGLVLHEMATGSHPFLKDTLHETIAAILEEKYSPPAAGTFPPPLVEAIERALKKNPDERYATVEELKASLMQTREAARAPAPASHSQQVVAIMPFADLSPRKDQDYFCDGLAEELLNKLAQSDELHVVSRTSSFRFRDSNLDIREIGRMLNATAVLEGSVRKGSDQLRITATLTKVSDGYPIWSERYDFRPDDLLTIQEVIAQAIANRLTITAARGRAAKPEAYELYLRGRHCWNQRTPASIKQSLEYYKMAIEADPTYGRLYAGLALSYVTLSIYGAIRPREAMSHARDAAEHALGIDRSLTDAFGALGCIASVFDWKWERSEDYFKEAIALDPKNTLVRQWYAINLLAPLGRFDEAGAEIDRACELDPASPLLLATAGLRYYFERRYSQAFDYLTRALELDPSLGITHHFLGQVCLARDERLKAIEHAKKAVTLSGSDSESLSLMGCAYALSGNKSAALETLEELQGRARSEYVSPVLFSHIYVGLGDADGAFDALEQACDLRATDLIWVGVRPLFDPIRTDPRFVTLRKRIGFPQ